MASASVTSLTTLNGETSDYSTTEAMANGITDDGLHEKCAFKVLRSVCEENQLFFTNDGTEPGQRIYESLKQITTQLDDLEYSYDDISAIAASYDFSEAKPGNGYRSHLIIVEKALRFTINVCKDMQLRRLQVIFRKSHYAKEIEDCNQLLSSLNSCLIALKRMSTWCKPGQLASDDIHTPDELLPSGDINQYCFYGRCHGFQFCDSIRGVLKLTSIFMCVYSELYYNRGNMLTKGTSILLSSRYLVDPELRAKRIVSLMANAPVDFCKSFWFMGESEVMKMMPRMTSASIAVNHMITIPNKPLTYTCVDGSVITVPVPSAHIGEAPLKTRLLSDVYRKNMVITDAQKLKYPVEEASKGLIFHCHGGGFVALNSKAHEIYLREWAKQIEVPILSTDYSLAPEAPYPRPQEELLFAYVWALQNAESLGSTAERIIFVGDSAGASLVTGLALRCREMGIRSPDGILLAYPPMKIDFVPSPARMMSLMDPLLPFGFMMRCLKAYVCPPSEESRANRGIKDAKRSSAATFDNENSFEEISESDVTDLYAIKSQTGEDGVSDDAATILDTPTPASPNCDRLCAEDLNKFADEFDDSCAKEYTALRGKWSNFFNSMSANVTYWIGSLGVNETDIEIDPDMIFNINDKNITFNRDDFKNVNFYDPYLSPYWASDESVKQLPPTRIVTTQFDPCLDDAVEFAKKLRRLNVDVDIEIIPGLPHGFLNLLMMSKDAYAAAVKCSDLISQLLGLRNNTKV